jgi:predicted Zn-dependent peptidase
MSLFKKTVLPNGIRIVSEQHAHAKSVSLGVWVLTGTRDEKNENLGISHFLEHLVFKRTKTKNAYQIAKSLESLGGDLNAYTTRESTTYHCQVLKEDWRQGLGVLTDLICNMEITERDFNLEKSVILQEIMMGDDSAEDIIYDHFFETVYKGHPLGRQILGKKETVQNMTIKKILDYYKTYYQGKNLIISAAGQIDHDELVIESQKLFKSRKSFTAPSKRKPPVWVPGRKIVEKDLEQTHVLVAFPAASYHDKFRWEAFVVNSLLGGGMTSKLYQAVREKKGLAYSVFSMLNTQTDSGSITIYLATDPKNIKRALSTVKLELLKIKRNGISKKEVEMFRTQVRGQLLMGSEDIENRMTSLGVNEITFGEYRSVDRVISEIESVTYESVNRYLDVRFNLKQASIIIIGPQNKKDEAWIKKFKFHD